MSEFDQQLMARSFSASIAEGARVHESCRIGQGAQIGPEAVLGADVVIGKNVTISGKVQVARRVNIHEFTTLLGPLIIEEEAVIGPGVVIGLVRADCESRETRIMESSRVGRVAQILGGLQVGRHARIRAGSLVTGDVPAYGLASQNPAVLEGYACPRCGGRLESVRMVPGAVDTRCSECGAGEYRFAMSFWKDAFNKVLLPNQALGALSPGFIADQAWDDAREIG